LDDQRANRKGGGSVIVYDRHNPLQDFAAMAALFVSLIVISRIALTLKDNRWQFRVTTFFVLVAAVGLLVFAVTLLLLNSV
jgi:hypothetical protein